MNSSRTDFAAKEIYHAKRLFMGGVLFLVVFGLVRADTADGLIAYILITIAAVLPAALWLRANAPGIPILPTVAAFHYLYYAVPLLRDNPGEIVYTPSDALRAAATVGMFLMAATLAWGLLLGPSKRRPTAAAADFASGGQIRGLTVFGLAIGVLFQVAIDAGWLSGLGVYLGVVRAVALTAASIACYLLGSLRARGLIGGRIWVLALAGLIALVLLCWATLYLVGGMQFLLAAVLGYVITAKRMPWKAVVPAFTVLLILHAGKAEIRARYWPEGAPELSIGQVPDLFAEWLVTGADAIATGNVEHDIIDRASLLYLLLRVQQMTPDYVPFLGGESYGFLGTYLVPRFLDPDKVNSQAGLALLNVRYGFQTQEGTAFTTVGWGLISEAFANFGYLGVIGAGSLLGALTAVFTRWSAGASPWALSTLISIAALVCLTSLEADFGFLIVTLWQTSVAALIFILPIKYLAAGAGKGSARSVLATARDRQPS
jgi:hypothetical protein